MRRQHNGGLALIEAIIALTLIAITAGVIMAQMAQANTQSGRSITQTEAAAIADAYLNEILQRAWTDPDGVDGESARAGYDDVDDYNGLNDLGARDAAGTLIAGLDRYRVQVSVIRSNALTAVPASDALRVSVSVAGPDSSTTVLTGYRLRP